MQCATSGNFFITIGQHLIHLLKFENSQKFDPSKKSGVWRNTVNNSQNNMLSYSTVAIALAGYCHAYTTTPVILL